LRESPVNRVSTAPYEGEADELIVLQVERGRLIRTEYLEMIAELASGLLEECKWWRSESPETAFQFCGMAT
jgi:hypothetical protein